jgi:hypothetical protein
MSEILSFEEMQHRYAGEWVLIAYTFFWRSERTIT